MFRIRNDWWRIRLVPAWNRHLMRDDGSYSLGCTDDNLKTIFISNRLSLRKFRHVLIHELSHAFAFSEGVILDGLSEEILCCFVERWADDILLLSNRIMNL